MTPAKKASSPSPKSGSTTTKRATTARTSNKTVKKPSAKRAVTNNGATGTEAPRSSSEKRTPSTGTLQTDAGGEHLESARPDGDGPRKPDEGSWSDLGWDAFDDFDEPDVDETGTRPSGRAHSDGVELVQAAARDLIEAARTMLDVAADVVEDPAAIGAALGALRGLTGDVLRAATRQDAARGDGGESRQGDSDGFQHIDVD